MKQVCAVELHIINYWIRKASFWKSDNKCSNLYTTKF